MHKVFAGLGVGAIAQLRRSLDANLGSLTLVDAEAKEFHHAVSVPHSSRIEHFTTPRGPKTCVERVFDAAAPVRIIKVSDLPMGERCPAMTAENLEGYLGVPLISDGKVIGAVEMMSKLARDWQEDEVAQLTQQAKLFLHQHEAAKTRQGDNVVTFQPKG